MNGTTVVFKVSTSSDTNVIHVDADGSTKGFMFEDDVTIDVVHHSLKGRWQVRKSKIHDRGFKKTVSGFKCCFLFVTFTNVYIIVPPADVKFCVYMCITEVANKIHDEREGVLIPNCEGVDLSIVLYRSHLAILFLDEEK